MQCYLETFAHLFPLKKVFTHLLLCVIVILYTQNTYYITNTPPSLTHTLLSLTSLTYYQPILSQPHHPPTQDN
jgi:hypothetical protein